MIKNVKTCWILTEGLAGTENQCLGLADALGLTPVVKRIKLRSPWRELTPWLRLGNEYAICPLGDSIAPPYPDLVIASGRKSIPAALALKGKSFVVQVQDPRIDPKNFDLVIVPQHDPARGDNVIVTTGSLHRVTADKLALEAKKFPGLEALTHPRVAVLIGGSSKAHTMTAEVAQKLSLDLLVLQKKYAASLMITASRRTGAENADILRSALKGAHIQFWDGTGDNPYFAYLHAADFIIVTTDSVSMTSEAISTGKPVYTYPLDGGAKRLSLFHKLLEKQGFIKPFAGEMKEWTYDPPRDTLKAAQEIEKRLR